MRLGSAALALAAGACGIVVVVLLLRSEPGPVGGTPAPVATTPAAPHVAGVAGGRIPTPTSPAFPAPPRGAIVLAREAGTRALALALVPGARPLVRVSVLSGTGPGLSGLRVTVKAGNGPERALTACGAGCYQARLPGSVSARRVSVRLGGASYPFTLPASLSLPDGTAIVARAAAVWKGLRTLVWHERLAASPTDALFTVYEAVAPDELSYTIRGASASVIIGKKRWDRPRPGGRWVESVQDPPVRQPLPFWAAWADVRVLGSGTVGGRRVWHVTFFDPQTPAWFEVWIAKGTHRTLELRMIAAAHFMHHVYGPFDARISIVPP